MRLRPGSGVDVGITARNPEILNRFYGGFLGMELVRELRTPEVGSHVWFYRCGDSHIKVYSRETVPEASNPPGGHSDATGYRYLAFRVESLDEALEGIEASGGSIDAPPTVYGRVRVAFVFDPEGNSIELIEDAGDFV